jgi:hypothetical protein
VVDALERCGFAVERISQRGVPDLLASRRGLWHTIECKVGKRGTTPDQDDFRGRHHAPVVVLRTPLEAIEWQATVP